MIEMLRVLKEDVIAESIVNKLKEHQELNRIQELKCKLGIEVFLINLGKAIVVYAAAILLQTVPLTFLFHCGYLAVRIHARGIHAKKSSVCTEISIPLFVLLPLLVNEITIPKSLAVVIVSISYLCLYKYAPCDTEKNRITDMQLRMKLRNKSLMGYSLCGLLFLTTNSQVVFNQVFFGSLLAIICILPITYKIIER